MRVFAALTICAGWRRRDGQDSEDGAPEVDEPRASTPLAIYTKLRRPGSGGWEVWFSRKPLDTWVFPWPVIVPVDVKLDGVVNACASVACMKEARFGSRAVNAALNLPSLALQGSPPQYRFLSLPPEQRHAGV